MVSVKTSSGMRRPRLRWPFRNFLGGRILPRAVPDMSGDQAFNFTDTALIDVVFKFLMAHDTLLIWT